MEKLETRPRRKAYMSIPQNYLLGCRCRFYTSRLIYGADTKVGSALNFFYSATPLYSAHKAIQELERGKALDIVDVSADGER